MPFPLEWRMSILGGICECEVEALTKKISLLWTTQTDSPNKSRARSPYLDACKYEAAPISAHSWRTMYAFTYGPQPVHAYHVQFVAQCMHLEVRQLPP
eukprot:scaffold22320_cov22-Tisochrysis_lutea.AAC.1